MSKQHIHTLVWTTEWTAQPVRVWINHFKMNSMDKDRLWPPSIISSFHPPLLSFLCSFLFIHHFCSLFCLDFHYISFSLCDLPSRLFFSLAHFFGWGRSASLSFFLVSFSCALWFIFVHVPLFYVSPTKMNWHRLGTQPYHDIHCQYWILTYTPPPHT